MIVLLCNLDPGWEFDALVHNHCLDLFGDRRIQFWNVAPAARTEPDIWGDWPRRIERQRLDAELAELLHPLPERTPLLLLFNLPPLPAQVLEQEIPALNQALAQHPPAGPAATAVAGPRLSFLADLQHRLAEQERLAQSTRIVTLPQEAYGGGLDALCRSPAVDHLALLERGPRLRLYQLRLLMAMFQDQSLHQDLFKVRGRRVVTLELQAVQGRSSDEIYDTVMVYWPALAQTLLSAGSLVHSGPGLDAWRQAVQHALEAIRELGDAAAPLDSAPVYAGPADDPLELPCPWFFSKPLPLALHQGVTAFGQLLDRRLEEHYQALNRAHQDQRKLHWDQEPEFNKPLAAHGAISVGIGEPALGLLRGQRQTVAERRGEILAHEQALLERLRGELTVETRRGAELYGEENRGYRRPRFSEDDALQTALAGAREAALKLAAKAWFWGALAVILLLALLPVLALRAPLWTAGGGVQRYLDDPALWAPDLAWLALFALSYLGFALYQVSRRRRALRIALTLLKDRAAALWARNIDALNATFSYQNQAAAMRRLVLLEEQVERVYGEVRHALADWTALQTALRRQQDYYRRLGVAPAVPNGTVDPHALQSRPPGEWLRFALERWPAAEPQEIDIQDEHFSASGRLSTRYLRACALLRLSRAPVD